MRGVQHGDCGPRLQHAEHRPHGGCAPVGVDGDSVPLADPAFPQPARELVGARLELAVGPLAARVEDGERRRVGRGPPCEQVLHSAAPPDRERSGRVRQLRARAPGDERKVRERAAGSLGCLAQRERELIQELPDAPRVEEVRAVDRVEVDRLSVLGRIEAQVELRIGRLGAEGLDCEGAEAGLLLGHVHEVEPDLEERRSRQVARRRESLEKRLERHVLVGVRAERGLADAREQFAEGRVLAAQPRAHDERIDEEADQSLGLLVRAVRDGRSDGKIVLP